MKRYGIISNSVIHDCTFNVFGNGWSDLWRKAQVIWFQNTLLLPQRVKSNSDQGFALLSFGEEPCPLSLSHGFFTIQPSPREGTRLCRAAGSLSTKHISNKRHFTNRGQIGMGISYLAEFRDRREGRWGNGVKNLNGSEAIPKVILLSRKKRFFRKSI